MTSQMVPETWLTALRVRLQPVEMCMVQRSNISRKCYIYSSDQNAFNNWMFGKRFKEDCLVLDSFVALPLAAKFSMAAVPGNEVKVLLYVRKKMLM